MRCVVIKCLDLKQPLYPRHSSVIRHPFCKQSKKVAEECMIEMFVSVLSGLKVIQSQQGFKVILFPEHICLQGSVRKMASN